MYDKHKTTLLLSRWNLGMCNWALTPTRRGFDSFLGFYTNNGDHFSHTTCTDYSLFQIITDRKYLIILYYRRKLLFFIYYV